MTRRAGGWTQHDGTGQGEGMSDERTGQAMDLGAPIAERRAAYEKEEAQRKARVALEYEVAAVQNGRKVIVDRKLLEEALEQIESFDQDVSVGELVCATCLARDGDSHAPDCRYVRVRDALTKALGR